MLEETEFLKADLVRHGQVPLAALSGCGCVGLLRRVSGRPVVLEMARGTYEAIGKVYRGWRDVA